MQPETILPGNYTAKIKLKTDTRSTEFTGMQCENRLERGFKNLKNIESKMC